MVQGDSGNKEELRKLIASRALFTRDSRQYILPDGREARWTFDFRPLLLETVGLDSICAALWELIGYDKDVQLGGLETTAIALTAGMVLKGKEYGVATNGFYIRKSRDKDGLQNRIEGMVSEKKIVLVDDGLNTGQSILRQVKLLESEGQRVHTVIAIVRFREMAAYEYFTTRGIKILSLFTLDDFPQTGGIKGYAEAVALPRIETPFRVEWKFQSSNPSFIHVRPKSTPVIDEENLYVGADNGSLWALSQRDGSVVWEHSARGRKDAHIFSSPALSEGVLYFGAHDGNVYALDAQTGKERWVYREADWVGSSPCVAQNMESIFVGLEFGWWGKKGGVVALDSKKGTERWRKIFSSPANSSPAYSTRHKNVYIGTDDGIAYCLDAKNGEELWRFQTGGPLQAAFALDEERGYVSFGSLDRFLYVLDTKTGAVVRKLETFEPILSTPLLANGRLYAGLLDRRVLAFDIASGNVLWSFFSKSRIYPTPVLIDGRIYCGSNDGRLYVLDVDTGKHLETFQATERIVNKIAYNQTTKRLFLPTYGNEIYCLSRNN